VLFRAARASIRAVQYGLAGRQEGTGGGYRDAARWFLQASPK